MILALVAGLGMLLAQVEGCPPCSDQIPSGAKLLDTVTVGPDATGAAITLFAYFVRDASFPSAEIGKVGALAVRESDGTSRAYQLGGELGELPFARLAVQDLTGDGSAELSIFGAVGAHSALGHVYSWNGSGYDLIGDFFGDGGVGLKDVDGDGLDEVMVGVRTYDRAQTRIDSAMKWSGSTFNPLFNRWSFNFDPSQADYPEAAVLRYYLAIAGRDYQAAYDLLGGGMQQSQAYAAFEQGFASTRDIRVEDLEVQREDDSSASVRVAISADHTSGVTEHFGGTWQVKRVADRWELDGAYITPV
jgi:hypothetical protein